ncbi:Nn.00g075040.m01.CDS01 [Neocucurbitaria sp. VM-36]
MSASTGTANDTLNWYSVRNSNDFLIAFLGPYTRTSSHDDALLHKDLRAVLSEQNLPPDTIDKTMAKLGMLNPSSEKHMLVQSGSILVKLQLREELTKDPADAVKGLSGDMTGKMYTVRSWEAGKYNIEVKETETLVEKLTPHAKGHDQAGVNFPLRYRVRTFLDEEAAKVHAREVLARDAGVERVVHDLEKWRGGYVGAVLGFEGSVRLIATVTEVEVGKDKREEVIDKD